MMNRITSSTLLHLSLLILATDIHAFVPFSSSRTTSHSTFNTRLGVFGDDSFDMDELRQRISQEAVPPLFAVTTPRRPEFVHAVFFNPHTDREGMHTIEYPQGSGNNVILAFEDANDCAAFSQDLQRQHFYNPTPLKMKLTTLERSCASLGVFCQVVPKGIRIKPPCKNVEHFGHDPQLQSQKRTLTYLFEMSDREVEHDLGAILCEPEEEFPTACWE